jgi:hypothetical protein
VVLESEPPLDTFSESFFSLANGDEGKSFFAKAPLINYLLTSQNQ